MKHCELHQRPMLYAFTVSNADGSGVQHFIGFTCGCRFKCVNGAYFEPIKQRRDK